MLPTTESANKPIEFTLFKSQLTELCSELLIPAQAMPNIDKVLERVTEQMYFVFAWQAFEDFGSGPDAVRACAKEMEGLDVQAAYLVKKLRAKTAQRERVPHRAGATGPLSEAALPDIAKLHATFAKVTDVMIAQYRSQQQEKDKQLQPLRKTLKDYYKDLKAAETKDPNHKYSDNFAILNKISQLLVEESKISAAHRMPNAQEIKATLNYLYLFNMHNVSELQALTATELKTHVQDYLTFQMPLRAAELKQLQQQDFFLSVIPTIIFMAAKILQDNFTRIYDAQITIEGYYDKYFDPATGQFKSEAPFGPITDNFGVFDDINPKISDILSAVEAWVLRILPGSLIPSEDEYHELLAEKTTLLNFYAALAAMQLDDSEQNVTTKKDDNNNSYRR